MIPRIRPAALLLALSAAACSGDVAGIFVDPRPVEGVSGNVGRYRAMWNAQEIDDYRFAYDRVCFCLQRGAVQVTVRDGRITDVRQVESGEMVEPSAWREYPTVDELFAHIDRTLAEGDHAIVRYHPTRGYPVHAELGTLDNDAGTRHLLSGLTPID